MSSTLTMRLKLQQSTNHRFKTSVTNIFMLALLCLEVAAYVAPTEQQQLNIKKRPGFARQLDDKTKINSDTAETDAESSVTTTNSYHKPHFTGNRSVIVQLFEWKFLDIAEECRLFLGPQGYAGVQLSPVLEHSVIKTSTLNHPWWERYEVVSYRLASRSGDESDFWSMSRICNDNGVRIYADVILNHMAAPLHLLDNAKKTKTTNKDFIVNTLLETNVNISNLNYPNVTYEQQDFHRPCAIEENTQDAHAIRNCQLNGHPDLDHSHTVVQQHIVEMLNKFIDMGVAGFRIDTAKYIWPIDLKKIFDKVKDLNEDFNFEKNSRPFLYYDVFDMGFDTVSKTEYATYGVVSEYLYPAILSTILNGKVPLSSLINWGPAMGFLSHEDSLVFVDSHDTQRRLPKELGHNHMLTHKQRIKYIMANAFMLAHPYGNIKRIMSSYYYAERNVNQGPPVEEEDDSVIRSPKFNEKEQCTPDFGWVCEHRWPQLVNMLKMANYFRVPGQEEESIIHFQTNGPNHVAFCRGQKAFIAMNNDPEKDYIKEVYACLEPGIYCDLITGGKKEDEQKCHGRKLVVNEHGYTQLVLPVADGNDEDYRDKENEIEDEEEVNSGKVESYGILVVYVESRIQAKQGQNPTETDVNDSETKDLKESTLENETNDNEIERDKEDANDYVEEPLENNSDEPEDAAKQETDPENDLENTENQEDNVDADQANEETDNEATDSENNLQEVEEGLDGESHADEENNADQPDDNEEQAPVEESDVQEEISKQPDNPEEQNKVDDETPPEDNENNEETPPESNEGEEAPAEETDIHELAAEAPGENEEQDEVNNEETPEEQTEGDGETPSDDDDNDENQVEDNEETPIEAANVDEIAEETPEKSGEQKEMEENPEELQEGDGETPSEDNEDEGKQQEDNEEATPIEAADELAENTDGNETEDNEILSDVDENNVKKQSEELEKPFDNTDPKFLAVETPDEIVELEEDLNEENPEELLKDQPMESDPENLEIETELPNIKFPEENVQQHETPEEAQEAVEDLTEVKPEEPEPEPEEEKQNNLNDSNEQQIEISKEAVENKEEENPQPENIEELESLNKEIVPQPEFQLEKPSADILNNLKDKVNKTANDVQQAGFFSGKSQRDGSGG